MNESVENIASNINVNYMMGDSYARSKEYPRAIEYFNKSLKYALKADDTYALKDNYKGLADIYKMLGDNKKYIEFTDLYIKASNDLKAIELNATKKSIDNIVKDKEEGFENSKSKLYWIIAIIISLAILLSIVAYSFHRNMKRKKQKIISETIQILAKKDEILLLKEVETDELKLQVNESFEEVIQLAKENKPEFLTRFQEVYPAFYQKLIDIEPKLLATEIKLCAMIDLGFTTKDIAEYSFVTVKAAQHRKFRLRKKLNIPSDIDIKVWLDEI
jgi:tetratricopeptide (TPR) repeat protein